MKNRLGIVCMSMGAVLILAALSLCFMNQMEDHRAGKSVDAVVEQMKEQIQERLMDTPRTDTLKWSPPDPLDSAMPEAEIDEYRYIGYLLIKSLELSLPVMSDWSYSQLKIAPCRYAGSSKTDNLVIAAHNYIRHFGRLKNLSEGDTIFFIDMDGIVTEYSVAVTEILHPTAVEDVISGEYDLTLFTCTYGGKNRVVVSCNHVEK